jgi:glutamyl-tRNA reductase
MILDFAEPQDVVSSELPPLTHLVQIGDMKEEAEKNASERQLGIQQAEEMIDLSLRDFCRNQKEAPLLKDFNQVEPSFDESFRVAWEAIQLELPNDCHPKVRKWAEGLVRKNLHLSREHLKLVLRKVTDPYESEWQ